MNKLDYIYRPVKIEDYNRMVDTINSIIESINKKPTIQVVWNEMEVNNIRDYTSLDISLPYDRSIIITDLDGLKEISEDYNIPFDISSSIVEHLGSGVAVNFNIHFEESTEVKDIAISQGEISLESLEEIKKDATPKPGRKKKNGTTKSTRSTTKKDSRNSKKGVGKKKS